jgi:protein kinase C substrate 80K-H
LPLDGQCIEYTDREYVYKLCFFQQTTQKPRHGGGETKLGSWKSWAGSQSNPYE